MTRMTLGPSIRQAAVGVAALLFSLLPVDGVAGQVRVQDLVVTGGFAVEGHSGNLASVTVPVVDSTDRASSTIGEIGIRSDILLFEGAASRLLTTFDLGMRQFVATGFDLRDYSPREKAARADLTWLRGLGRFGTMSISGSARTRSVDDRPPMPLYLQAAYDQWGGTARYQSPLMESLRVDVRLDVDRTDYEATPELPQLRLLDRRSTSGEVGLTWGGSSRVRVFTGVRDTDYPQQASFDESDPYRRDRTWQVGGRWSWSSSFLAELGVVGTVNRSNSRRPEYDAVSVTGDFAIPLPIWDLSLNLYGALTAKSYIEDTDFARLVPGEEADNASVLFLDVNRPIADNLGATLRFGWSRAETDIGDSYYERWGATLLFNFRPLLR